MTNEKHYVKEKRMKFTATEQINATKALIFELFFYTFKNSE